MAVRAGLSVASMLLLIAEGSTNTRIQATDVPVPPEARRNVAALRGPAALNVSSTRSNEIKTYTNNEFGFIKFRYPGDFSLREERHTTEEATQYKIPLLSDILERAGSYQLDRGAHEYKEVIVFSIYNLPHSYFHNQTKKIIGNIEWSISLQTGSEYFMEARTSGVNYTYIFQLHSNKPQWLSSEAPTTDVLERLLSTVSFQ
jgi:hypothetical protein